MFCFITFFSKTTCFLHLSGRERREGKRQIYFPVSVETQSRKLRSNYQPKLDFNTHAYTRARTPTECRNEAFRAEHQMVRVKYLNRCDASMAHLIDPTSNLGLFTVTALTNTNDFLQTFLGRVGAQAEILF